MKGRRQVLNPQHAAHLYDMGPKGDKPGPFATAPEDLTCERNEDRRFVLLGNNEEQWRTPPYAQRVNAE